MATVLENRLKKTLDEAVELGPQPFNRDCLVLAFGSNAKHAPARKRTTDGQRLAGSGALVFEGEALEMPNWH